MELTLLVKQFKELFKTEPRLFKAPGRVNLIGEHTDYNNGFVLPAAIDKYTLFAMQHNSENKFRFYSYDYKELMEISVEKLGKSSHQWANYLLGVLAQFKKANFNITGIDCVFGGNIPTGAGLSSSAALEVGFAVGVNALFNCDIPAMKLVQMAQKAEHEYAGVMCGIMDQFASMFGKAESVIKLDCRSLEYEYFPLHLKGYKIVLCDTKVKHTLASSEYNLRRQQCEAGVAIIHKFHPQVQSLRDVNHDMLEALKLEFDPTIYRRCSFVVKENLRVERACAYLTENNLVAFGELMHQSHEGLRVRYEVSCIELDFLEDLAKKSDAVIGARMMGGGFGGCTINIVHENKLVEFTKEVTEKYTAKFGVVPVVFVSQIAEGAGEVFGEK